MLLNGTRKNKAKSQVRGPTKYRGITTDARLLGYTRTHLWLVLTGKRRNDQLVRRYHALKRKAA